MKFINLAPGLVLVASAVSVRPRKFGNSYCLLTFKGDGHCFARRSFPSTKTSIPDGYEMNIMQFSGTIGGIQHTSNGTIKQVFEEFKKRHPEAAAATLAAAKVTTGAKATSKKLETRGSKYALNCCPVGGWGWTGASQKRILEGISYLRNVNALCGVGVRSCVRVSCSWDAAIYLCNDNYNDVAPNCAYIATFAQDLINACSFWNGGWGEQVCGQEFDTDSYNVIVPLVAMEFGGVGSAGSLDFVTQRIGGRLLSASLQGTSIQNGGIPAGYKIDIMRFSGTIQGIEHAHNGTIQQVFTEFKKLYPEEAETALAAAKANASRKLASRNKVGASTPHLVKITEIANSLSKLRSQKFSAAQSRPGIGIPPVLTPFEITSTTWTPSKLPAAADFWGVWGEKNYYDIQPNCGYIATYAVDLNNDCPQWDGTFSSGQEFDTDNYNVITRDVTGG
ncbi:hypothetical protein G7Y89_g8697 [Cudoniella acicularis]|uniref:Uncharacterized protein n=1 Tax=Cudoniella acicularis TaxID=354080 RepID=A0A8H4RJT2_9HELO|nr:hypothetical protein G7Y89_g8697 [Cudoniella acicularis]